jgi:hypothetical protein
MSPPNLRPTRSGRTVNSVPMFGSLFQVVEMHRFGNARLVE